MWGLFVIKDGLVRPFIIILCKDDDTFYVFVIPNWFKCLNWDFDSIDFRYVTWERSYMSLCYFSWIIAEKWYCIGPFCRILDIICKCVLGKAVSEVVEKFQKNCCIWQIAHVH